MIVPPSRRRRNASFASGPKAGIFWSNGFSSGSSRVASRICSSPGSPSIACCSRCSAKISRGVGFADTWMCGAAKALVDEARNKRENAVRILVTSNLALLPREAKLNHIACRQRETQLLHLFGAHPFGDAQCRRGYALIRRGGDAVGAADSGMQSGNRGESSLRAFVRRSSALPVSGSVPSWAGRWPRFRRLPAPQ